MQTLSARYPKWHPMRFDWRFAVLMVLVPSLTAAEPAVDYLPAPPVQAEPSAPKRTLAGIDCTFGVACPIIWQPPRPKADSR